VDGLVGLVAAGARVKVRNANGLTPLLGDESSRSVGLTAALLAAGAEAAARPSEGATPAGSEPHT
jgi:hypothetical protein